MNIFGNRKLETTCNARRNPEVDFDPLTELTRNEPTHTSRGHNANGAFL